MPHVSQNISTVALLTPGIVLLFFHEALAKVDARSAKKISGAIILAIVISLIGIGWILRNVLLYSDLFWPFVVSTVLNYVAFFWTCGRHLK